MSLSRPFALATVAFVAAPFLAVAAPQPIDLATTLRLAGADNLSVRIAREKLAEARADADVARERLFPWVTAGLSLRQHENNLQTVEGRIIDADKRSFSAGVGLNAQWDFGDVYYQKLAAQQRVRAEEAALTTQRQNSVTDAALAYYELLRATATIGIATEALDLSSRHHAQLVASASAGVTFAGDVHRVATARARNETAVQQAREQARIAAARLAEILKLDPAIGDGTGQQIKPAGGGFGIGHSRQPRRQSQAFHQRHDIDTALFQHGTLGQIDLVHRKLFQTGRDLAPSACQKRGAHAVGLGAKAQIKAGGLHLGHINRRMGCDRALRDQLAQRLRGKHTEAVHGRAFRGTGGILNKKPPARPDALRTVFAMVGPERFELSTSRPPDGRANQAALRPDTGGDT